MRSVEDRLRSYEPLWENWTYTGEFLGEGAMSSVFEIQSTAMGTKELAALKIITVEKGPGGEVMIPENTLNEIKILRTLSGCPNIVRYQDSTQRKIYDKDNNLTKIDILIRMEKLKPLSEGARLNEEQIVALAKDMCKALINASEYGVIHRDIKPQNIFVSEDGTYKLGDFGISKIVSEMSHHFTMNIGTLAYAAPELQSTISKSYDISSDIYSLGLVLYVFLNGGYLPFADSGISINDAIAKRLGGAPFPSPSSGSGKLKSIVMRACNYDVVKRYSSPVEMLEDLEFMTSGGKKFVPDPFATLDANLDTVIDREDSLYGTGGSVSVSDISFAGESLSSAKVTSSVKSSGGLKISSSFKTTYSPPAEEKAPGEERRSGLKINMKKAPDLSDASVSVSEPESVKTTAEKTDVYRSGLKINLKGKGVTTAPEDSLSSVTPPLSVSAEPAVTKAEKTKEKEKDDDFFFTPSSL